MSALNTGNDEMQRLNFLMIDDDTRRSLAEFLPALKDLLPQILDAFYSHLRKHPEMMKFFSNESRVTHAKTAQFDHWMMLFSGRFDADYFTSVKKIGLTLRDPLIFYFWMPLNDLFDDIDHQMSPYRLLQPSESYRAPQP